MKTLLRTSLALLSLAGILSLPTEASAAKAAAQSEAELIVYDNGQFFTPAKVEEAEGIVSQSRGSTGRQVRVHTWAKLDEADRAAFEKASDKKQFGLDWSKKHLKPSEDGVDIFMVKDPPILQVLVDSQMQKTGFDPWKVDELRKSMTDHLGKVVRTPIPEARGELDAALISAANYLKTNLPTDTQEHNATGGGEKPKQEKANAGGGSGIMGYVCIGLAVLAGIWLVMGLFRAFSGGGGGGGPGGMGGGGGGFGSSLLGGLFGAVAGMWLYNNVFGGASSAWGGDNSVGGGDVGGGGEVGGAGDFSGDQSAGGGDWGGGGSDTGGDWGGGGGDWGGGGGDWGGGGGDY